LYIALFYVVYKRVKTSIRLSAKVSSARQQFTIETLEKRRGIRTYGLTTLWQSKFRDLSGKEMMAQFHLDWLGMVGETLAHALTLLAAVATIGYGAHMIWQGTLGTGALVATMILAWRILTPFYSFCTMIPRAEQIRNSIIQVNKLMDLDTEAQLARTASRLPRIKGDISFSNVSLRYSDESDDVFANLSCDIKAGYLVVITGENGAGKSSFLKMLQGLYKPVTGSVQIDGFDIRQLDAPDLRRQIAYVPQQADFFYATILENLRISNPIATQEDIEIAMDLAGAHHDVAFLPDGYNTLIDRYSVHSLPSNLALKLSLARLYLHTSPILLIDEIPNMILSGDAGKNLRDYLARIKGSRTCLMVTYREDVMTMADTLIHMRVGQMPQVGKTELLIKQIMEAA
jgi:ATP-binding cassette subfamily C protein LapB